MTEQLGVVTSGSFNDGLIVRLDAAQSTEEMQVGNFVVVEGHNNLYFSTIANLELRLTDPTLASDPPGNSSFLREALAGVQTYAVAQVKPSLMLTDKDDLVGGGPRPVRTIPMHFAILRQARGEDFANVFGEENPAQGKFALGYPLTMDQPIPLDLQRLIERSNGVFGQSGTGKSVLTRLLLCGIIKAGLASTLIFDMHSEYAQTRTGENNHQLRGLRELFGSQIHVYSLDASDQTRQALDSTLQIGMNQIEPEDIELLADELNLTPTFAATAHSLRSTYGERWLKTLLTLDGDAVKDFCASTGANEMAVNALRQKLRILEKHPYIVPELSLSTVDNLIAQVRNREHVILQFGRHSSLLDYMLVANIITRRIHSKYTDQVLSYDSSNNPAEKPHPLMIVLEEAHKFLAPAVARQTIFGTIAREMRKYSVTLLVVDQRPSGIDTEVLSQLGTKITGLLSEEHDIDAVLTGIAGRSHWRGVLASLETKQQCLVLGHAIPMPMVLRTRSYNNEFFASLGLQQGARTVAEKRERGRAASIDLFGEDGG